MYTARAATLLLSILFVNATESEPAGAFRRILDASQAMMTGNAGAKFPGDRFNLMTQCMHISPNLLQAQDHAWAGFVDYYQNQTASGQWGKYPVPWHESFQNRNWHNYTGGATLQTLAYNDSIPHIPIYEPCNFVSNIAYYRVAPEVCHRAADLSMSEESQRALVESLSVLGFGSAFFHGSDTKLGNDFDVSMIGVLAYVCHQVAVEHLPTLGKPQILRDLTDSQLNRSATLISNKIVSGLMSPVSNWDALLPHHDHSPSQPKDIPDFEFVIAALVTTIIEAVLPNAINSKLVPFLMGLFGVNTDSKNFILNKFVPTVSEAISQRSLHLVDQVELLRKLLAFGAKIFFAFAFQESYFSIEFFLRKDVNFLGGLLMPVVNVLGDVLSGDTYWEKGIPLGYEVYPGNEKCRLHQPHAKWHEMSADAFLELIFAADKMNKMTSPQYSAEPHPKKDGEDVTVFTRTELEGWASQALVLSFATPARDYVKAFVKEISSAFTSMDANGDGRVTYSEFVSKLEDLIAKDTLDYSWPEAFVRRLLQTTASEDQVMV